MSRGESDAYRSRSASSMFPRRTLRTATYTDADATAIATATAAAARIVSRARKLTGGRSLPQRVPDAAHGLDQPRLAAGLGLAPQVADVDLERVRRRPEVEAPHAFEDQRPRQHLPRVEQEELEQQELRPGELDLAVATADIVRRRVEREVREAENRAAVRRAAAPRERAHAREELLERERLHDVV